jgi:hypothetical protein
MAIGNAFEKGALIVVYDEKNRQMYTRSKGLQPGDGLISFTNTTVNIRQGPLLVTYNEKGQQISSRSIR